MMRPMLSSFDVAQLRCLLDSFKTEYEPAFSDEKARVRLNPFKLVKVKGTTNGIPTATISSLYGSLPISHWYGTKTVLSSEELGRVRRKSVTVLFDDNNVLRAIYDSSSLTTLRCAIMAAYVLQKTNRKTDESILLVGAGKVNHAIMEVLSRLEKFYKFDVVSRSPLRLNSFKRTFGVELTKHLVEEFEPTGIGYDIISTATTNIAYSDRLKPEIYKHSKLVLSFDTGYMMPMDPKFTFFSDYPEQLFEVHDMEFPFDFDEDFNPIRNFHCMTEITKFDLPAIVYFYGIGLGDILVAQHAYYRSQK